MSTVDELVKKHDAYEETLVAQEDKISMLVQLAEAMLSQDHYAQNNIVARRDAICQRHDRLKKAMAARRRRLLAAREYQQYLHNLREVRNGFSSIYCRKLLSKTVPIY